MCHLLAILSNEFSFLCINFAYKMILICMIDVKIDIKIDRVIQPDYLEWIFEKSKHQRGMHEQIEDGKDAVKLRRNSGME